METQMIASRIASLVVAIGNCRKSGNAEWQEKHEERLDVIVKNYLPSGSGIDNGCRIDMDKTTGDRIVLSLSFHHMNEAGMYDGWTDHQAIVTPSFDGINVKITGRDRNGIKEYLQETIDLALSARVTREAIDALMDAQRTSALL